MQVAHHHRERMRTGRGTEAVVRVVRVGHPVAQRLVDRVLQRRRTVVNRDDLRAEQSHPCDVECLPVGVDAAHVDDALHTEQCAAGRGGHTVLTGTGLGDDAGLTHALGEQQLTEHVVDLVRTGVVEVFALQENPCATGEFAHARGFVERRGTSDVVALQPIELTEKFVVRAHLLVGSGHVVDNRHERLGNVTAAVHAEVSARVGFRRRTGADSDTRSGELGAKLIVGSGFGGHGTLTDISSSVTRQVDAKSKASVSERVSDRKDGYRRSRVRRPQYAGRRW